MSRDLLFFGLACGGLLLVLANRRERFMDARTTMYINLIILVVVIVNALS